MSFRPFLHILSSRILFFLKHNPACDMHGSFFHGNVDIEIIQSIVSYIFPRPFTPNWSGEFRLVSDHNLFFFLKTQIFFYLATSTKTFPYCFCTLRFPVFMLSFMFYLSIVSCFFFGRVLRDSINHFSVGRSVRPSVPKLF